MCPEHTQHSASEHSASVPMAQMTAQNTSLQFNPSLRERLWHATSFHETKPEKKIRPPEQWANTRTDERDKGNDKWNHTSILTFGKKIWGRQMKYTKGKTVTAVSLSRGGMTRHSTAQQENHTLLPSLVRGGKTIGDSTRKENTHVFPPSFLGPHALSSFVCRIPP